MVFSVHVRNTVKRVTAKNPQTTIRKNIFKRRERDNHGPGGLGIYLGGPERSEPGSCVPSLGCAGRTVPLQNQHPLCWNSHPVLIHSCEKFPFQTPPPPFFSYVRNNGSRKEIWSFVSSFWMSSNVRLFTFQCEWENYILPYRARLQYPVQHTCG